MGGCLSKILDSSDPASQQQQKALQLHDLHDAILGKPYEDVNLYYTIGKELGRGGSAITYLCTENSTGMQFACKSISKRRIVAEDEKSEIRREIVRREIVRREIQIIQRLSGQPNIVQFKATYEDTQFVHIVMEYCAGGTLVDRILARERYSERAAASVFRVVMNVVNVCHSNGVIHRDLKPENFLFTSDDEDATLKASDFGLAFFFEEGRVYEDMAGTPFYVAPEVFQRRYGKEIDIWSVGVILYNLLSGGQPFWAETAIKTFKAIMTRETDFKTHPWPYISSRAKDLIRKMLTRDPQKRIAASEVLKHPWLSYEIGEASNKSIDTAVFYRVKEFRAMNKLKKLALKVLVENLPAQEIQKHKEKFTEMDIDNNGTLTYNEFKAGLAKLGSKLTEVDFKQYMEAADIDGNGTIDYTEFVTATMQRHRLIRFEYLYKAFHYFDRNNDGFITVDELETAFKEHNTEDDEATVKEIMSEVDRDEDSKICYDEFYAVMKGGTHLRGISYRNLSHIFR